MAADETGRPCWEGSVLPAFPHPLSPYSPDTLRSSGVFWQEPGLAPHPTGIWPTQRGRVSASGSGQLSFSLWTVSVTFAGA